MDFSSWTSPVQGLRSKRATNTGKEGGAAAAGSGLKRGRPRILAEGRVKLCCFSGLASTNPETLRPVNNPVSRRMWLLALISARIFSILLFTTNYSNVAQPQALEDCVERLARKALALPHERRMVLVWTNHGGLSEERT